MEWLEENQVNIFGVYYRSTCQSRTITAHVILLGKISYKWSSLLLFILHWVPTSCRWLVLPNDKLALVTLIAFLRTIN